MTESPAVPDSRSVSELIEAARPTLVRILVHFRIPAQDAEDLFQETALHFLRKRPEIRDPQKWLSGAMRNECLLYWRRKSRALYDCVDQAMLDLVADQDSEAQEQAALKQRMREHIASLKPSCRSVLELRYQLGYDNREIAEKTGYRPSSVDKIAQRCVAALCRRILGGNLMGRSQHA